MGFPFETAEWAAGMEAIFPVAGGSMPGLYSLIAIVLCIGALALGQKAESSKYKNHK